MNGIVHLSSINSTWEEINWVQESFPRCYRLYPHNKGYTWKERRIKVQSLQNACPRVCFVSFRILIECGNVSSAELADLVKT